MKRLIITDRIRKFDTDYFGFCRASAAVNLGMDAMIHAMEADGLDRDTMLEKYGAVWMAAHFRYTLDRPLLADEQVQMETEPLTCGKAHMLSQLRFLVKGLPVGEACCAWILADAQARKILRPQSIPELANAAPAPKGLFRRGILPPQGADLYRRLIHYSDCDMNGHFNSPRYADCICDAHWMESFPPCYVSKMQISFAAESRPGEILDIRTWREEGQFMTHAACGGKARFSACFVCKAHERVK